MPWNCAICAAERPTAEEPMEILDDTTHAVLNVCAPCYRDTEPRCQCCQVRMRNPVVTDAHGANVCHDCTEHHFLCTLCNHQTNTDQIHDMPDGASACTRCYERRFAQCGGCGSSCLREELDEGLCATCARGRVIRSHNYKPRPNLHGHGPLYFGVELEVECGEVAPGDVAHEVINEIGGGFVYAKHDGSISHGFEMVSHPFSHDWYQAGGQALWKKLLSSLRKHKCRSYDTETCGMHVHVTRAALTAQQLLRLQRLSHNNPDLILMMSRRRKENLSRWANPRDTEISEHVQLARGTKHAKDDRYAAVNVTGKTVEIRIFRGTCDEEGFFGNIEAVRSLVEFSKQGTGLFPRAREYFAFLKEHKAEYPNLIGTVLKEAALA